MRISQLLDIYEQKLQLLPKSYRWMMLGSLVVIVIVGGYFGLIEKKLRQLESKKEHLALLERSIYKQSPRYLEAKIAQLQRQLVQLRTHIEALRSQRNFLLGKLRERRVLFLSPKNFSKLLEKILSASYRYGLELEEIAIDEVQKPFWGNIFEKKVVDINGTGEFLALVRFLRGIEASKLLLKIERLHIETNGTIPSFFFRLKLYGASR